MAAVVPLVAYPVRILRIRVVYFARYVFYAFGLRCLPRTFTTY